MTQKVLTCIANHEFNSNAISLKQFFKKSFESIIIDSSTPGGFPEADITIPNNYYPGLWNESVSQARKREATWLLFIASDIQLIEVEMIQLCIYEAINDPDMMLWTPSIAKDSRCFYKSTISRLTAGMRHCGVPEGFFFMTRTSLLKEQYPVPEENFFGFSIDRITALKAHELGKVAVDDRVIIFHPKQKGHHQIDKQMAFTQGNIYRSGFQISDHAILRVNELERIGKEGKTTPALKPAKSLDLGCGDNPKDYFETGHTFGIDVRNPGNQPNIELSDLFIHPIPYENSSFDYISAFDFIEHVPRVVYLNNKCRFCFVELMNEIHRVLKPGGIFASLTPSYPNNEAFQDPTHVNIITDKTFPNYFCKPLCWAKTYGFKGSFALMHQSSRSEGKLLTFLRAIKQNS